MTLIQFINPMW
jgi:hypothetical protein